MRWNGELSDEASKSKNYDSSVNRTVGTVSYSRTSLAGRKISAGKSGLGGSARPTVFEGVEVGFGAEVDCVVVEGGGDEGALTEVVLGYKFEGVAGFCDGDEAVIGYEVEVVVRNDR